jgi:hypothetical protein
MNFALTNYIQPILKINQADLRNMKIRSINVFKLIGGFGLSYFIYKTIKIYLKRRKFGHIPGPKTKG